MKPNIIDLQAILLHETDAAVKISIEEHSEGVWLPKSRIEIDGDMTPYGVVTVSLPEPLAQEKGLI